MRLTDVVTHELNKKISKGNKMFKKTVSKKSLKFSVSTNDCISSLATYGVIDAKFRSHSGWSPGSTFSSPVVESLYSSSFPTEYFFPYSSSQNYDTLGSVTQGRHERNLKPYSAIPSIQAASQTMDKKKSADINLNYEQGNTTKWETAIKWTLSQNERCQKIGRNIDRLLSLMLLFLGWNKWDRYFFFSLSRRHM